jgi:hypothetical protein
MLAALEEFARHTPAGCGGIFAYSGHAMLGEGGLLLKPLDASNVFPADTALPLSRVLRILKSYAKQQKKFFVILDCCRDGPEEAAVDDVPPNVCVLYACGEADAALEASDGGVLTRSIVESLRNIAADTGERACSVRTLCARLGRELFLWRPALALRYELCGSAAERFEVPIAPERENTSDCRDGRPVAMIRYGFGTQEDLEKGVNAVAVAIFNWYGIPYGSKAGQAFVRDHFRFEQSNSWVGAVASSTQVDAGSVQNSEENKEVRLDSKILTFEVCIPRGCARWASSEFLAHLLSVPIAVADTLVLTCPRKMAFAQFKHLQHVVGGEWIGGPAGVEHRLAWKNEANGASYRGVATISQEQDGMKLYLTCETLDCYEMPLRNLMPVIADVFDLLRSIIIREE